MLTLCKALTREIRPVHDGGKLHALLSVCDKRVGSLTSPASHVTMKMQDRTYGLHSPYPRELERLTICRCNLQRQHILISYFKTLSVGPVWGSNPLALALS